MQHKKEHIRNIAIVAHIDHGKTTMLDSLLKQSHIFRDNQQVQERVMDSYDQERERGITIFAKHTSIHFRDYCINIIDTPGHADFSAEVERILGMVESVLLLVDAQEGPMPQTRFVLSKSLQMGLRPIVVVNKVDRPAANPHRALDLTFDLFTELGAKDYQLDFPFCFASGLTGFATRELEDPRINMEPLLELIVEKVPHPEGNSEEPFLLQASTLFYDDYVGRQACGKVRNGSIRKGAPLLHITADGQQKRCTVQRIEGYLGLQKVERDEATTGDIVIISGIPEVTIGDTLADPSKPIQLPPIHLDEPTVAVDVSVNSSPFSGRSGKFITMNKLRERLEREQRANISLRFEFGSDQITVAGRGELHLAVLIEALRREGYELSISRPRVVLKQENGVVMEPVERTHIEVPEAYAGSVIEELSRRKGELQNLETTPEGITRLEFLMPTQGLVGYRNDFLTVTRGLGILTSHFDRYSPRKGSTAGRIEGVMISACSGKVTPYASFSLQERGTLFVDATSEVYEGMIVGQHSRDNDIVVNITKEKQLTNMRASGTDENIILTPPRRFTLEQAIGYIQDDELVEVTPATIRMRKKGLTENDRKKTSRK